MNARSNSYNTIVPAPLMFESTKIVAAFSICSFGWRHFWFPATMAVQLGDRIVIFFYFLRASRQRLSL